MAAIVDLSLHKKQMEVYSSRHRFKVVVAGRRWGKTALSRTMILRAAMKPRARVWYIAPTFRMAKQIMWDEMLDSIPKKWISKVNHSSLTVTLKNRTEVSLKGADRPDTLRGVALDFVVLDEFQDMKADVWVKVIRPTLSSTRGGAMIIGTPKAFNYLYELWKIGQRPEMQAQGQWKSWQFKTSTSPFIPVEEIEAARADMDPKSYEQEYEACHIGDTEIALPGGRRRAICEIESGEEVLYLDDEGKTHVCVVEDAGCTGEREVVEVTLETGEKFSASMYHKMKVYQ